MATRPSLNSLFDAIVDEATIAEVKSELAPEPEAIPEVVPAPVSAVVVPPVVVEPAPVPAPEPIQPVPVSSAETTPTTPSSPANRRRRQARGTRQGQPVPEVVVPPVVAPASFDPLLGVEDAAEALETSAALVRLAWSWIPQTKSLREDQRDEVAGMWQAYPKALALAKRLFDSNDEAVKALNKARAAINSHWRNNTLPWVDDGVRVMSRERLSGWVDGLTPLLGELETALNNFGAVYARIVNSQRERLGDCFNPSDYPSDPSGLVRCSVSYPSLSVPDWLPTINPRLYQQQREELRRRFQDAAVRMERNMAQQFTVLIDHLIHVLTPAEDGTRKVFRDSAVENIEEFFATFERLRLGEHPNLRAMMDQARGLLGGVDADMLRSFPQVADQVRNRFQQLEDVMLSSYNLSEPRRMRRNLDLGDEAPAA